MSDKGVILFHTTAAVMRAEKLILGKGLKVKLIPPPRQFSSDCGIAIQFEWADKDQVMQIIGESSLEYEAVHQMNQ